MATVSTASMTSVIPIPLIVCMAVSQDMLDRNVTDAASYKNVENVLLDPTLSTNAQDASRGTMDQCATRHAVRTVLELVWIHVIAMATVFMAAWICTMVTSVTRSPVLIPFASDVTRKPHSTVTLVNKATTLTLAPTFRAVSLAVSTALALVMPILVLAPSV